MSWVKQKSQLNLNHNLFKTKPNNFPDPNHLILSELVNALQDHVNWPSWHFTVFCARGYGEKQQWRHTESV